VDLAAARKPSVIVTGGGTGGHLYPGLAVANAILRLAPDTAIFFIGAARGIERIVLPERPFPYELLDLHPLYRRTPTKNLLTVRGAMSGWGRLGRIFHERRPGVVLGTGGYASALTLAYAWSHGTPIVQQIADSQPGLAARLFAPRSRELYLGYPEARGRVRAGRVSAVLDTGNPIEPPPVPLPDPIVARSTWGFGSGVSSVVLVFGGSQGAAPLNRVVDEWVAQGLPPSTGLIWATGPGEFAAYERRQRADVVVRPYLAPISEAYAAADVVLARAGAMTTAELCAWGKAMVLVPLPHAAQDHQTANARALDAAGAAVMLAQQDLTLESLRATVGALLTDPSRRARVGANALARAHPRAAETIARRILSLVDLR